MLSFTELFITNIAMYWYWCRWCRSSSMVSVVSCHWHGTNVKSSLISSSQKRCRSTTATRRALSLQKYVLSVFIVCDANAWHGGAMGNVSDVQSIDHSLTACQALHISHLRLHVR